MTLEEKIKEAIKTTLVIQNPQSIDRAVIKIANIFWEKQEQKELVKELTNLPECDRCGCHPSVIYRTPSGQLCQKCYNSENTLNQVIS